MLSGNTSLESDGTLLFNGNPLCKEEVDLLNKNLLAHCGQKGALKIGWSYLKRVLWRRSGYPSKAEYTDQTRYVEWTFLWRISDRPIETSPSGEIRIHTHDERWIVRTTGNFMWKLKDGPMSHSLFRNRSYEISLDFPLNESSQQSITMDQLMGDYFDSSLSKMSNVVGTRSLLVSFAFGDGAATRDMIYGSDPLDWPNDRLLGYARGLKHLRMDLDENLQEKALQAKVEEQGRLISKATQAFAIDKAKELQAALDEYESLFGERMPFPAFYSQTLV